MAKQGTFVEEDLKLVILTNNIDDAMQHISQIHQHELCNKATERELHGFLKEDKI